MMNHKIKAGQPVLIGRGILPMYAETGPSDDQVLIDEALYGWSATVLEVRGGYARIRTDYRYEGWVDAGGLIAGTWREDRPLLRIHRNEIDILRDTEVDSPILISLPKGSLVAGCPEDAGRAEIKAGWIRVALADGREGHTKASFLSPMVPFTNPETLSRLGKEAEFRDQVAALCESYRDTTYRWGGKTPRGIDCSGLVFMAYLFCGIPIYRDAAIREGFPLHPIAREAMKKGDLLFFKGHVAMYLGGPRELYIHSTARAGDDGLAVNSLREDDALYREDLAKGILEVGSIF